MAFPATPLDVRFVVAFGANLTAAPTSWTWTDLTADLRTTSDQSVAITVGKSNRAKQGEPNNAAFSLNNFNGQYTVDNPAGANFPYVEENVPGIIGTARNANPTFEVDASDWVANNGTVARSTVRAFMGSGSLLFTPTGGFTAAEASIAGHIPVRPGGYVYVDAWVYSVAGYGSVYVAADWIDGTSTYIGSGFGPTVAIPAGVWTYLGAYIGPAPSNVATCVGKVGESGTPGAGNTLWIDEARLTIPELCGYVDGWTPTFDSSGKLPTVNVSMSGVRRRYSKGTTQPTDSALRRAIRNRATQPVAWWPMEDGQQSTQAASGLASGTPLSFAGAASFAALTNLPGALQAPDLKSTTAMSGPVSMPATGQWQVSFWTRNAATGSPAQRTIMRWTTNEPRNPAWDVVIDNQGGGIVVSTIDNTGASISTMSAPIGMDDKWHQITVIVTTVDASHVNVVLYADGANVGNITNGAGSYGAGQITGILLGSQVDVFSTVNGGTYGLSAIAIYSTATYVDNYTPGIGYLGETAAARVTRLCGEESVPVATINNPGKSMAMGAQPVKSFVDILQECEDADGGMLIEPFDGFGFGYVVRSDLYNLPVALTIDQSQDQLAPPFAPVHDDLLRLNDSTVTRQGGSSARYVGDTSRGIYKESVTLNVATDDVLLRLASWRVHLGKPRNRIRHPALNINFANANAAAFGPALAATRGVGIRIQVINTPAQLPQGVDMLVSGYIKTLAFKAWSVSLLGSPYDSWLVFIVGDPVQGRLDTAGSQLTGGPYAQGATSLSVQTNAGPLWITTANQPTKFPLNVDIAGQLVTVTGITGTTSPQTFTVQPTPRALANGAPVKTYRPSALAL